MLQEEVGRWLHLHAQQAKVERTAELIEQLKSRADQVEVSSDEEDNSHVED